MARLSVLFFILFTNVLCAQHSSSKLDTLTLFDSSRQRAIPVAIYTPTNLHNTKAIKLVILNHGYGQNAVDSYLAYSYIANFLTLKGIVVISIQHELPTDSLLPTNGILQVVRRPFWDRGADNIHYVLSKLPTLLPITVKPTNIALIGHSNGGDMVALFPTKYPGEIAKIITLDNRRMPLPLLDDIKVYSLRSSDKPADIGVLPKVEEQVKYGVKIVQLKKIEHNDMDDTATNSKRKVILRYLYTFLNN